MVLWGLGARVALGLAAASACTPADVELPLPWDDEALRARAQDPARFASGEDLFALHCASCHGADGKGGRGLLGPDLTDDIYLHGIRPTEIYRTIAVGVVSKGMQPWRHLGDERVGDLAAYVVALREQN